MDYESVMLSGIMSFFLLGVPAGLGVFIIDDLSKGLLGDPFIACSNLCDSVFDYYGDFFYCI